MVQNKKLLITGGAGFIGSALVRQYISETEYTIINVDKLTYAGNLNSLADALNHPRHIFEHIDICDIEALHCLFRKYQPDAIIHLAAESHVDRSIDAPAAFIQTNIVGTVNLLEVAREYWYDLGEEGRGHFRFQHISTDEVYGDLEKDDPAFTESTPYSPSSPYSASKASSDHLVRAWHRTYGLPILITNCSNNYGPYQFPEKLIPLMILNALEGKPLPVYGRGDNVRDWLYVEDHAQALRLVLERGGVGEVYNIGGKNEHTNLDVVNELCSILDELIPNSKFRPHAKLITFVDDRPGHDQRYAINPEKIERELSWTPSETFESGLRKTVHWYLSNLDWCRHIQDGSYHRERLGVARYNT